VLPSLSHSVHTLFKSTSLAEFAREKKTFPFLSLPFPSTQEIHQLRGIFSKKKKTWREAIVRLRLESNELSLLESICIKTPALGANAHQVLPSLPYLFLPSPYPWQVSRIFRGKKL
jgi:hypothetical protein